MDAGACLTDKQWILYAEGKLDAATLLLLNQHVEQCVICADIKSGIDVMQEKHTLAKQLEKIQTKVERKVMVHKTTVLPLWTKVAASVLIVAVVGVLVSRYRQTNQQVALEKPVQRLDKDSANESSISPPEHEEKIALATPPTTTIIGARQKAKDKNPVIQAPDTRGAQSQAQSFPPSVQVAETVLETDKAEVNSVDNNRSKKKEAEDLSQTLSSDDASYRNETPKSLTDSYKKEARVSFKGNSTAPAVVENKGLKVGDNQVVDTLWAQQVRNLLSGGQLDSARVLLNKHVSSPNVVVREYAFLLEGIYYINAKKWELAKASLQSCIGLNGIHEAEARRLKRELP